MEVVAFFNDVKNVMAVGNGRQRLATRIFLRPCRIPGAVIHNVVSVVAEIGS